MTTLAPRYLVPQPNYSPIENDFFGGVTIISISPDRSIVSHCYDEQKGIWTDRRSSPTILTEKSSFYISQNLKMRGSYRYGLVRRYSVIKFLLMKEIFDRYGLPWDVLAQMVEFSD
jgi:hypothetical protein